MFDKAAVVFAAGPRPGKLDAFVLAPFEKGGIDELRVVIAVYAYKREREGGLYVQQGFKNPFMGLIH